MCRTTSPFKRFVVHLDDERPMFQRPAYLSRTFLFDGDGKVTELKLSVNGAFPITTGAAATTGDTIRVTAAYQCAHGSNPLASGCDLRTRWLVQAADGTVLLDDPSPPQGTSPVPVNAGSEGTKSFVMPAQNVTITFSIVQLKGGFASEQQVDSRSITVSWLPTQKQAQGIEANLASTDLQQGIQGALASIMPWLPWILGGALVLGGIVVVADVLKDDERRGTARRAVGHLGHAAASAGRGAARGARRAYEHFTEEDD